MYVSDTVKIGVFYYSGVGNTSFIANELVRRLHVVKQQQRITQELVNSSINDDFDIFILGFPIYFFQAPLLVKDFICKLEGKNRKIFFFCTKAMYSSTAINELIEISIKQRFIPSGSMELYMPGTDALVLMCKKNSFCEKFFKLMHSRHIGAKIDVFINSVLCSNGLMEQKLKLFSAFFDYIVLKKFEKYWMAYNQSLIDRFYADERCTECMKCVKGCPRGNIALKDKIEFGQNCDTCFFCIHHCPVEAIQIGDITQNTVRYNKPKKLLDLGV